MRKHNFTFYTLVLAALFLAGCKPKANSDASAAFEKELQEKIVSAKDGEVIELPEGSFNLSRHSF